MTKVDLKLQIDRRSDAAYVLVHQRPVARTEELDPNRRLDYDADGEIVGMEFLDVSRGVNLAALPYGQQLASLFEDSGIRLVA